MMKSLGNKIKVAKTFYFTSDKPHYENVPFEVPSSWVWTTLGEICIFLSRGKSPKYKDDDRTYPVFAQKCNLKEGGISLEQARFIDPNTIDKWAEEYKLKTGDILINSTGTGTVGRTRLFNESCLGDYPFVVPDSHVSVVRTHDEIVSEFIYAYISSNFVKQYLEENLAGSTNQKELYIGVLDNLNIPLPPYKEQKRIADEIERWSRQTYEIDVDRNNLTHTIKQVKNKVLDLAIHGKLVQQDPNDEPATELLKRINPKVETISDNGHYQKLPKGWCECTLGSLFLFIRNGINIRQDKSKIGYPITRIETISSEFIDRSRMGYAAITEDNYSDYYLQKDDILMSHINSPIHVGKCALCDIKSGEKIIHGMNLLCLRPYADIEAKFILMVFRSPYFKDEIRPFIKNAVNQASINIRNLSSVHLHLPPVSEQHRIVAKIEEIFVQLDAIEASL